MWIYFKINAMFILCAHLQKYFFLDFQYGIKYVTAMVPIRNGTLILTLKIFFLFLLLLFKMVFLNC